MEINRENGWPEQHFCGIVIIRSIHPLSIGEVVISSNNARSLHMIDCDRLLGFFNRVVFPSQRKSENLASRCFAPTAGYCSRRIAPRIKKRHGCGCGGRSQEVGNSASAPIFSIKGRRLLTTLSETLGLPWRCSIGRRQTRKKPVISFGMRKLLFNSIVVYPCDIETHLKVEGYGFRFNSSKLTAYSGFFHDKENYYESASGGGAPSAHSRSATVRHQCPNQYQLEFSISPTS